MQSVVAIRLLSGLTFALTLLPVLLPSPAAPRSAAAQSARPNIVEHPMRAPNSRPFGLAVDGSGNIWFSQWSTGIVGTIEPSSGRQTTYFIPTSDAEPAGLVIDPAGDVWVAEHGSSRIARLRPPAYGYDFYELPTVGSEPYALALDTVGTVWFTAFGTNELGRLDPVTRQIRTYRIPTPDSRPAGIVVGPNGLVYFAEWAANKLGRFDPSTGEFTEWALPNPESYVYEIALDSEGRVWYAEHGGNSLGRLDPATGGFERIELPTQDANPYGLAFDQAGYLWFSEWTGNKIGRLDPATGAIQEFVVPTSNAQPGRLIVDASATVWFTQWAGNKIGQLATLQPVSWAPALFRASEGRDSGLQIQNLGTGPATVSVRYFDAAGTLLYTDPAAVVPIGGAVTHYLPGKPLPAGFAGSATILSDTRVAAIVNETRDVRGAFASAAYDVPRRLGGTLSLPLIVRGRDGAGTSIAIHNPGNKEARITARFLYASVGAQLPATSTSLTATTAVSGTAGIPPLSETIAPGGTRLLDSAALSGLGAEFVGSAVITSDAPVAAVVWLLRESGGAAQLSAYTPVAEGAVNLSAPLLFRDYNGWNTEIAVQNLADQPARFNVAYFDRATGQAVAPGEGYTAAPGATVVIRQSASPNLPAGWVGSAVIAGSGPLAAVVSEVNPRRGLATAYNGLNLLELSARAAAPLVMKNYGGWNTSVQVQNLGDAPATVTITYFDRETGVPVGGAIESQVVQPNTAYTFAQAGAPGLPAGFVGSAIITGSGRLAVVVNAVNDARSGDAASSYTGVNY